MSNPSVRTLLRALEIVGSKDNLATALKIPAVELEAYLSGQASVPNQVFLEAIDLVAGKRSRTEPNGQ